MRLKFEVNASEKNMQRSLLIHRVRKLVFFMIELSFCEVTKLVINLYYLSYLFHSLFTLLFPFLSTFLSSNFLSSPFLLSGYMELYSWCSYRYEEKGS